MFSLRRAVRSVLLICLVAGGALGVSAPADAAGIEDVVLLKNGGRLRGVVVEDDPEKGVRVKLADGTIRVLRAADVSEVRYGGHSAAPVPARPPPPPPTRAPAAPTTGSLHVDAGATGTVTVDGGEVGQAPVDVADLAPGRHRVVIRFARGGKHEDVVLIQPGKTLEWTFDAPKPSNVKLFQVELGAYFGYGTQVDPPLMTPFECCQRAPNPFGFGVGARAGILFYRVYVGADVTYFFGSSSPSPDFTAKAVSVAPRAGYDIHFNDGFVAVAARPYVGVEAVLLSADYSIPTQWNFAPGVLLSAAVGSLLYFGVDSRLSVGAGAAESFSVFATGGVRLF